MNQPIRLVVQQPSLAKYRVPVFRELARREGIEFKLLYGTRPDLPNAEPDGFDAEAVRLRQGKIAGQKVFWHTPQLTGANPKKTDVLILTWNPRYLSLIPALMQARLRGVPTILWGHGSSQFDTPRRKRFRFALARLATALLFYNKTVAQEWIDAGRDPHSVFVAQNTLDLEPIRQARQAWQDPRKILEFQQQQRLLAGPTLLFVSRLSPENRLDMLIEATRILTKDFPQLQVIVVGKGPQEQQRLERLAAERGLADRVRFVGAIYEEMRLAPWFLSADVFCYPIYMGLSMVHAFGYGLPIVTGDDLKGHGPEIEAFKHGENGLFYRHGDVGAFAAAIRQILTDKPLAARMSENALRTAEEELSLVKMVDGMEAAVRYCAAKRRNR